MFQVVGVIITAEGSHAGELALIPRDLRDGAAACFPPRVPLNHLVDIEAAPATAGEEMQEARTRPT